MNRRRFLGALAGASGGLLASPAVLSEGTAAINPLDAIRSMRLHELGALVFRYGLWIALPMIGMLMFLNLVMGIISRIAPQMSIFSIGFPITIGVGLTGLWLTLPMMQVPFTMAIERMLALFM